MPTQTQLQDGKALTLGALFLVDNAPGCPEEMSWHDFSDWAIAEHLKRHSYYQHQKGNRKLVTVAKMRSRVLYLCNNYAKPGMPKPDHKEFKDKVDILFGLGRTQLLKKDLLGALGYDRDTFSESRLNKHASEGDRPASAKTDRRPETETAKEDKGSDASNKNSHGVGEQECRVGEAHATDPISTQPTLPSPPSNGFTSLLPPDNDQTAPNSNSIEIRERREQNETTTGEQPRPSRSEGRRRRSSVSSQTRPLIADNGTLCVSEEPSAASSGNINPRGHDECVVGAKRKHKQDHGPHKRQCQVDNTARQDDSNGREPPSNSTPQAEQASKVPPTVNGSKGPGAPRDAVTNRKNQHQLQLARLNLDQQGRNMKSLYSDIQDATDVILSSIGKIRNTPSPLHPESSGPLKDLYARCWGPQWEEVRVRQIEDHVFTTPQVTASLLSAFLYDRVLARGVRLEEIVSNVVKKGGSLGEALLEEFDISTRGESDPKFSRTTESTGLTCSRGNNRQESTYDRSPTSLLQISTERRDPPTAIKARSRNSRRRGFCHHGAPPRRTLMQCKALWPVLQPPRDRRTQGL